MISSCFIKKRAGRQRVTATAQWLAQGCSRKQAVCACCRPRTAVKWWVSTSSPTAGPAHQAHGHALQVHFLDGHHLFRGFTQCAVHLRWRPVWYVCSVSSASPVRTTANAFPQPSSRTVAETPRPISSSSSYSLASEGSSLKAQRGRTYVGAAHNVRYGGPGAATALGRTLQPVARSGPWMT